MILFVICLFVFFRCNCRWIRWLCVCFFSFQTAEAIMQRNSSCLSLQMVCDPLLKERVSWIVLYFYFTIICCCCCCCCFVFFINANPVFDFISCQSFGIVEGKRVQDLRDMAKAAGQSMPGFTPPEGETQEQVMFKSLSTTIFIFCLFWVFFFGGGVTSYVVFILTFFVVII